MASELPVSAPGAMSTRTDLGPGQAKMQLPDAAYGEQAEFQQIQGGAPMAQMPAPTGLFAPTERPDEPVTAGAPIGEGSNMLAGATDVMRQDMLKIQKYLPQFEAMAKMDDTPESFRLFVRYLRGQA